MFLERFEVIEVDRVNVVGSVLMVLSYDDGDR